MIDINKNKCYIVKQKSMSKIVPKQVNKSYRLKTTIEYTKKKAEIKTQKQGTNALNQTTKQIVKNRLATLDNSDVYALKTGYFHPDIYHKPKQRKKYFCELVDSYMKNQTNKDSKAKATKNDNSNLPSYQNIEIGLSNYYVQQMGSLNNSPQNSPMRTVKMKRAMTAGNTREKTQQVSIRLEKVPNQTDDETKMVKNRLFITPNKSNLNDSVQKMRTSQLQRDNPKVKHLNRVMRMKGQCQNSKRYLKNGQQILIGTKNLRQYNPENDINNSISDEMESQNSDIEEVNRLQKKIGSKQLEKRTNLKISNHNPRGSNDKLGHQNSRLKTYSSLSVSTGSLNLKNTKNMKVVKVHQNDKEKEKYIEILQKQIKAKLARLPSGLKNSDWQIKYLYQHQLFQIYYLANKKGITVNQSKNTKNKNLKIKKFAFSETAQKMMNAVQKVRQIGVSDMWLKLPKLPDEIKQSQQLYLSPSVQPLRQELFHFIKEEKSSSQAEPIFHIQPRQAYWKLFHNNCEDFRDIIVSVARNLEKMEGNLINNKISLDNLYRLQEKDIKIGDWGCAAVSRTIMVAGQMVNFKDQPILNHQQNEEEIEIKSNKWLLQPQNLPPQIIRCIIEGSYSTVWDIEKCPQIWSLGIIIFQILTFIPVWIPYKSIVSHKIPKRGFLFDQGKRLGQIYSQQCKMPGLISKWIRQQKRSPFYKHINPQIINLMRQMLQITTKLRPRPRQIIERLNNN